MTSIKNSAKQACGFMNSLYTFIIFILFFIIINCLGVFYLVISFIRRTWLNCLKKKFPDLEFIEEANIRSVVDTHRNMGIITLLIGIKGNCDPELIKKKLSSVCFCIRLTEDILEKKQINGQYVYKHLRYTLTAKWGWYAWQKPKSFNADNHLIFASPYYRGRAISDANLQECVSETVSKYLVQDIPPWQITVFQLLTAEKYYMLIRFHHMLLSPKGIDLASLLTLSEKCKATVEKPLKEKKSYNKGNDDDNDEENNKCLFSTTVSNKRHHPFQELYKAPKAVPILMKKVQNKMKNVWEEFLNLYDPSENPSILKNPDIKSIFSIFAIVAIDIIKQLKTESRWSTKIIGNCFSKKGLSKSFIFWIMWKCLNPFSWMMFFVKCANTFLVFFIKLPTSIACEIISNSIINNENCKGDSRLKSMSDVWNLIKDSVKEVFYYWKIIYNGPRAVLEEFFFASKCDSHQLQLTSLCGRKVVSWSSNVPIEKIREIEDVTGASMSEILITATSASLREFLVQYSLDVPDALTTTARYFCQEKLINNVSSRCGSGLLCLPLPIRNPFEVDYDPVTELRAVQQIVLRARLKQPALYLASLTQLQYGILTQVLPSPLLRLILNLLSRRFPVALSEIISSENPGDKKYYLWGQEIGDLIYWKPPQANICISLILMTFGKYVKLGVMADALLSPYHTVITANFAQHVWELAAAAGVMPNFENYSNVSDESDTPEITRSFGDSTISSSGSDFDLDENNLNQNDSSSPKYPLRKKLNFNIPL